MKKAALFMLSFILMLFAAAFLTGPGSMVRAEEQKPEPIKLLPPQTDTGKPLMRALKDRKSSRSFRGEKLSPQTLANLLWAAFGINRPDSGKRTAPSAMNWQEIDVYVALEEGAYRYNAEEHALEPVSAKDLRGETGSIMQPFVKKAPVNLVYVADFSRMGLKGKLVKQEDKSVWAAAAAGFIGQNVYLFCASEGLATVVRGLINKKDLRKELGLREDQKIILAQTVGYPKE